MVVQVLVLIVLVSAQHATLVRYYGQNETINYFQLHILL